MNTKNENETPNEDLEARTGALITLEVSEHRMKFELSEESGEAMGRFVVEKTVLARGFKSKRAPSGALYVDKLGKLPDDCLDAWERAGERPLWVVRSAYLYDPKHHRRGLGKLAYRALIEFVLDKGGVVGPDRCGGGVTGYEALVTWQSLCRDSYRCEGPLVVGRK